MPPPNGSSATLVVTPHGRVRFVADPDAPALDAAFEARLRGWFESGDGFGLWQLGSTEVGTALPSVLAFWRDFSASYVAELCGRGDSKDLALAIPSEEIVDRWLVDRPPMVGGEYLGPGALKELWLAIHTAATAAFVASRRDLQSFLREQNPRWNLVGRVFFNLAENRKDVDAPFAFLATYTARLSAAGKAQHLPLSQALSEFAAAKKRDQLLALLLPVKRAAETCPWLDELVRDEDVYHPLRWSPAEAWQMLQDVPKLETAGIVVRAPAGWQAGRPARPVVKGRAGSKQPSLLGTDALVDFEVSVSLGGEPLTETEIEALLRGVDGLRLVRGQWVEVDRGTLDRMLERFRRIEERAAGEGLSFGEAMRLVAGATTGSDGEEARRDAAWSELSAGPWLAETLQGLRHPDGLARVSPGPLLHATLRPYQEDGVRWLYLLTRLGLGACLADDMGLGKTMQVLSLLLIVQREAAAKRTEPSLLVVPASLLGNWAAEAERFAPSLRVHLAHASATRKAVTSKAVTSLDDADLVITSYGALARMPALLERRWRLVIADEAQALKNPSAKQTKLVKKLRAHARIALTGTPVENRLGDLWSLFDFALPGLLGTEKQFGAITKQLRESGRFGPLRELVRPYLLRRMKTDKTIIADLPDKTEVSAFCTLAPLQAALYQEAVDALSAQLASAEGIGRRGLVLAFLVRFKQICNHPAQWLGAGHGDGVWRAADSGKLQRLQELAETIGAKQEKLLVFTQFREACEPLAAFLATIFGRPGLTLHGGTPVGKRRALVKQFQEAEDAPFFVLSLKAGGAGLTLTAASHVVHFDRWWNPAVENQATDRAFRIGQKRNVLVHKLICQGTVEDRVDQLIASKRQLVTDVLEGGEEIDVTSLSDDELLGLVALDIGALG